MYDDPIAHVRTALPQRQRQVLDPAGRRPAAVLLLVYPTPALGHVVLLTKRTSHLEHHRGEVSLPGGKVEAHDDGLLGAALRETHEEIAAVLRAARLLERAG